MILSLGVLTEELVGGMSAADALLETRIRVDAAPPPITCPLPTLGTRGVRDPKPWDGDFGAE
jgi:hypothetical protein